MKEKQISAKSVKKEEQRDLRQTVTAVKDSEGNWLHNIVVTIRDGHQYAFEQGVLWVDGNPRMIKTIVPLA